MAQSIRSAILTYNMAGPHLYCHPNTEAWARAWRRPLFDRSFRKGAAFAVYCLTRGNDCHAEYRLALGLHAVGPPVHGGHASAADLDQAQRLHDGNELLDL